MAHVVFPSITEKQSRLDSIDLLRGFAVFGILFINMEFWALPSPSRNSPMALEALSLSDTAVWYFIRIFTEYKFFSLFSLLFGAGIAMQIDKAKKKGINIKSFQLRRLFWLGIFGALHAIIFNPYDILFMYAVWGVVIFYIGNKSALIQKRFMWLAFTMVIIMLILMAIISLVSGDMMKNEVWTYSPEKLKNQTDYILSSLHLQLEKRSIDFALKSTVAFLLMDFSWRIAALMALGMVLYQKGVLSAEKSIAWYKHIAKIGFIAGGLIAILGLYLEHMYQWSFVPVFIIKGVWLHLSSLALMFAYLAVVMIWYKKGYFSILQNKLKSVGRMALSNYLMHTLIGTFIFYGYGLGLYRQLGYVEQACIVLAIWFLQLFISDVWLKYFRFGPFEWLWRCLSYQKKQPFFVSPT